MSCYFKSKTRSSSLRCRTPGLLSQERQR